MIEGVGLVGVGEGGAGGEEGRVRRKERWVSISCICLWCQLASCWNGLFAFRILAFGKKDEEIDTDPLPPQKRRNDP